MACRCGPLSHGASIRCTSSTKETQESSFCPYHKLTGRYASPKDFHRKEIQYPYHLGLQKVDARKRRASSTGRFSAAYWVGPLRGYNSLLNVLLSPFRPTTGYEPSDWLAQHPIQTITRCCQRLSKHLNALDPFQRDEHNGPRLRQSEGIFIFLRFGSL